MPCHDLNVIAASGVVQGRPTFSGAGPIAAPSNRGRAPRSRSNACEFCDWQALSRSLACRRSWRKLTLGGRSLVRMCRGGPSARRSMNPRGGLCPSRGPAALPRALGPRLGFLRGRCQVSGSMGVLKSPTTYTMTRTLAGPGAGCKPSGDDALCHPLSPACP